MIYEKQKIEDLYLIKPKEFKDARGSTLETYRQLEMNKFVNRKINFVQNNLAKSFGNVIRGLHYQSEKAAQGDQAARNKLGKFTSKVATAGRFIKGALGPLAIASELAIEGGIALNQTLNEGVPIKQAFADSLTNKYLLGPKLQIDKEAELAKEFAKGEDFAMAERGRRMAPFMAQSKEADAQRLKKREQQLRMQKN